MILQIQKVSKTYSNGGNRSLPSPARPGRRRQRHGGRVTNVMSAETDLIVPRETMTAPILSRTEILVHGLADGTAMMLIGAAVMEVLKGGDPFALVQAALALLVLLLSVL